MTTIKTKEYFEALRQSLFPDQVALLYKQNKEYLYDQNTKPEILFICTCSNKKHTIKQYARVYTCPDCHKKWVFHNDNVMKITSNSPSHMQYVNIPKNTKTIVETKKDDNYIKLEISTITNQFKILRENNTQAKYRLQQKYKELDLSNKMQHIDDRRVLSVFRHIYISTISIIYDVKSKTLYKYVYDNLTKQPRIINTSYIDFDHNNDFKNQIESLTCNTSNVIGKVNNKVINEIATAGYTQINDAVTLMSKPWLDAVAEATGTPIASLSDLSALLAYTKLKTLRRIIGRNKTEKEYLHALQINRHNIDEYDDEMMYSSISSGTIWSNLPSNLLKKMRYLDKNHDQLNLRDMTRYLFTNASKNETKLIHSLYDAMSTNDNKIVNILVIYFIYYGHMYINDPHKRNTIYQTLIDNIGSINNKKISYMIDYMTPISKLSITNKTKTRLFELLISIIIDHQYDHAYEPLRWISDIIQSIGSITKVLPIIRPMSLQHDIKQSIENHITKIETNNPEHFDNKVNSMVFLINDHYPMLENYSKEYYNDFDFNYDHIDPSVFTKQIDRFDMYLPKSSYDLRRIGQLLNICVGNGYYANNVRSKMGLIVILKDRYSEKLTCMEIHIGKTKNKNLKYTLIQAKGPYNNQNFPLPIDVIQTITDFCNRNKINIECPYDLKHPLKLKKVI